MLWDMFPTWEDDHYDRYFKEMMWASLGGAPLPQRAAAACMQQGAMPGRLSPTAARRALARHRKDTPAAPAGRPRLARSARARSRHYRSLPSTRARAGSGSALCAACASAARRVDREPNCDPKCDPDRAAPRAAHDTTAQHADAIIDFYEAAAGRTDVPVREDHPAFSERYSAESAPAAHAKQLSEQPGEAVRRRRRHHLQVR